MAPEDLNEEEVFRNALQYEHPEEQASYVKKVCEHAPELCDAVQALLQQHHTESILDTPALDVGMEARPVALVEDTGTVIGRYKLLEKIGEGGMAVVYMAEQERPIRRKVALKIIKMGMDTKQVIARFEAERQALAMMDHPNIAKVFDAGATETGRPYFVMELVRGVSITEYCDQHCIGLSARLKLFMQVCSAVQHAHQKGIIHRDIKPSNVMVTQRDGTPLPKIIDFGIAKAINQRLTEKTMFTRYAQIIGTPAYMSPEQAELSEADVDTRSDVYSLGILLYELLTGTTPFSEEELRNAGYAEMTRIIREKEPPRPSSRLTQMRAKADGDPKLATRHSPLATDLDWIVMKALEKDRARRYETVNGLVLDIERHLSHEPVLARGPSTGYRLRKLLERHRSLVLVALSLGVFVVSVTVILSMWNRDRLQLAEAEGLRHRSILSQAREHVARLNHAAALASTQSILHSKHVGPEAQLLYAGILVEGRQSDEAVILLKELLDTRPEIAGAAHALLARVYWEGNFEENHKQAKVNEHRQKAEELLPDTAEAYFLRALTTISIKEKLDLLSQSLDLDPGHYESRRLRAYIYHSSLKYEALEHDALVMTALNQADPLGYSLRAIAWRESGHYLEALEDYDRAIARTPSDSPSYVDLVTQRCETLLRMEDYAQVIAKTQASLKRWADRPVFQYYQFFALTALGHYDEAATLSDHIVRSSPEARIQFENWCAKYVFDTLAAERPWHPLDHEPVGAAFLPMVEAEETYRILSAQARRVATNGFYARLSPDGQKLAFSTGVKGYSGVAILDLRTKETDLLIAGGKDPAWSPNGKYIAFTRDCQVLRLVELATVGRVDQHRPSADEELWVMNADGTQPQRLARGGLPQWGPDSEHIYYQTRNDGILYSISLAKRDTEPQQITKYRTFSRSISPGGKRIVYLEGESLKFMDLTSQAVVAEQLLPLSIWSTSSWSPTGREILLGGPPKNGLWIYDLHSKGFLGVLDGGIKSASLSADGTRLAFVLRPPLNEMWAADLDPNVSIAESLGPTRTVDEHLQELVAYWTRRIEADPTNAGNYRHRAEQYWYLHQDAKVRADELRCWAALHPGWPPGIQLDRPWCIMQIVNGPFNSRLVLFLERLEDEMPLLRIAFGRKGRGETSRFEIPLIVSSLLGFPFLQDPRVPPGRPDFTFGQRESLGRPVNSEYGEEAPIVSPNGLELYFASNRPGGFGELDIWRCERASIEAPWGPPENLGSGMNGAYQDVALSLSSDGLTLYSWAFAERTFDLYTAKRPTLDAPWGERVNLGTVVNLPGGGTLGGIGTDMMPVISSDDLELFFASSREDGLGSLDIYVTRRVTHEDPWGPPENLGPLVNSFKWEGPLMLSPDGLVLFIAALNCPGRLGRLDTWMLRRPHKGATWSEPVNLGLNFNTPLGEMLTSISPDGQWAYFSESDGEPKGDLWKIPIISPLISTPTEE